VEGRSTAAAAAGEREREREEVGEQAKEIWGMGWWADCRATRDAATSGPAQFHCHDFFFAFFHFLFVVLYFPFHFLSINFKFIFIYLFLIYTQLLCITKKYDSYNKCYVYENKCS
jgi:hypothetical protein